MNIIRHKNWYFAISLLVIIPGLISLLLYGLNPSIDFAGGSRLAYTLSHTATQADNTKVQQVFAGEKVKIVSLQPSGQKITVRVDPIDQNVHNTILANLKKQEAGISEDEFTTVGPTIGKETTTNALWGVVWASILIVLYIAFSFRKVPKPANGFQFGITAIIALLHDALVLLGIFSLLGHFFGVEIDSLFVTAVLTVIGFSVHDTIVVFDRIRENLIQRPHLPFAQTVNSSILQTLGRSLNTSLTVILVLFTLLLFGGDSTHWFVVALLIGVISGTYSSIFNAAPLLVLWNEVRNKSRK